MGLFVGLSARFLQKLLINFCETFRLGIGIWMSENRLHCGDDLVLEPHLGENIKLLLRWLS